VVIGSNVYATPLRAEDVLRTLDPVAVAGSSSYKEMFSNNQMTVLTSTWSGSLVINLAAVASNAGEILTGKQIDTSGQASIGSLLMGGNSNDQLWGKAGWDILDGGAGNDLIRAGNGRDIIIGGLGADELHGDFGWNTYKSEKDGFSDLIAIKSDQSLVNWLYGKAGNNPDGAKCDIIEGLDAIDKIKIIGCATSDLSFAGTTAKGLAGIGIYAKGALEALYTGGDLSLSQIQAMTTGDASAAAMANQITSYGWTWV
jgi:Ca2+-binding RTX toxin-like protein